MKKRLEKELNKDLTWLQGKFNYLIAEIEEEAVSEEGVDLDYIYSQLSSIADYITCVRKQIKIVTGTRETIK